MGLNSDVTYAGRILLTKKALEDTLKMFMMVPSCLMLGGAYITVKTRPTIIAPWGPIAPPTLPELKITTPESLKVFHCFVKNNCYIHA